MSPDTNKNENTYFQSLNLLAANELALESLYHEYARQHPDKAAFWQELAIDEHRHALLVLKLAADVSGHVGRQGRFKAEAIRTFTEYLTEQEAAARRGEVPFEKAVILASYIEGALIEQKFFEQLPLDDRRLKYTLSALKRETERHAKKIKDALSQSRKD
jgi:hypothetical protein